MVLRRACGIAGLPATSKQSRHAEAASLRTDALALALRKCGRLSEMCKWKTKSSQSCHIPWGRASAAPLQPGSSGSPQGGTAGLG